VEGVISDGHSYSDQEVIVLSEDPYDTRSALRREGLEIEVLAKDALPRDVLARIGRPR